MRFEGARSVYWGAIRTPLSIARLRFCPMLITIGGVSMRPHCRQFNNPNHAGVSMMIDTGVVFIPANNYELMLAIHC